MATYYSNNAQLIDGQSYFDVENVWLVKVNGELIANTGSLKDILTSLTDSHGLVYESQNLWNIGTEVAEVYIEYTGPYDIGIPTLSGPPIFISKRDDGQTSPIAKAVTLEIGFANKVDLTVYPPEMHIAENSYISPKRFNDPSPALVMEGNRYILNVNGTEYKDVRDNTVTYWTGEETRGSLKDIVEQNPELSDLVQLEYSYNDFELNKESTLINISEEILDIKFYLDLENSTRPIQAAGSIEDCVYNRATYYNGRSTATYEIGMTAKVSEKGFECSLSPSNSLVVRGKVEPNLIGFNMQWGDITEADKKVIVLIIVDGAAIITKIRYHKNEENWEESSTVLPNPEPSVGPAANYPLTVSTPSGLVEGDTITVELTSSLGEVVRQTIEYVEEEIEPT